MKSFDITVRGFGARYFDIIIRDLPVRDHLNIDEVWYLIENAVSMQKLAYIRPTGDSMYLGTDVNAYEISYIAPKDVLYLSEQLDGLHSAYSVAVEPNEMTLAESSFGLFRVIYTGAIDEDNMYLSSTPVTLDAERTLHLINIMYLNSDLTTTHAIKHFTADADMLLDGSTTVTAEKSIAVTNIAYLGSGTVGTEMRIPRTLGMMDGDGTTEYTLATFDNIALTELDYITI